MRYTKGPVNYVLQVQRLTSLEKKHELKKSLFKDRCESVTTHSCIINVASVEAAIYSSNFGSVNS